VGSPCCSPTNIEALLIEDAEAANTPVLTAWVQERRRRLPEGPACLAWYEGAGGRV